MILVLFTTPQLEEKIARGAAEKYWTCGGGGGCVRRTVFRGALPSHLYRCGNRENVEWRRPAADYYYTFDSLSAAACAT